MKISSHCYLKGVVLLESMETIVGEEYMLSVIRNLVATRKSFNLDSFLFYFKDIPVDKNISLAQLSANLRDHKQTWRTSRVRKSRMLLSNIVNYGPVTWVNIFSKIDENPAQFSAVGRAQLVTDFCYFYAHDQVDRGTAIREIVTDMVYRNSKYFELCDWHLFWCHSAVPATLTQLLKRIALGVTQLFDNDAAFGCRTGMAATNLNVICSSVFGTKCI
ncbi:unnamed protein product [Strongylus vulgaris]|uniref:Uncharacterized protein n=1 Tax=Strongylus vulgaris TaxID=40348 RepID=A0A3P7KXN8_STRVU|nr:unnamed protein product [Strongylus vulgaris]